MVVSENERDEQDPSGGGRGGQNPDGVPPGGGQAAEMMGRVSTWIRELEAEITELKNAGNGPGGGRVGGGKQPHPDGTQPPDGGDGGAKDPFPEWCWFAPPAEPKGGDPRARLASWVAWYNTVYVGVGDRATNGHIPPCWAYHPAVAAEVATLAATWRETFCNPDAPPRDAQYWHHTWLPGFTQRMQRVWLGDDCLRNGHTPGEAPPRPDVGAAPKADRWTENDTTVIPAATGANPS
jgi:hypothetical protein